MPRITPCLWFDNQGEDAAKFYASVFPNSRITAVSRYGEGMMQPAGSVLTVMFELDGQEVMALNGGPGREFSEAVSFMVACETQDEIDHYWSRLSEGGAEIRCGWLRDRFGLSWQIVPANLRQLLDEADPLRRQRVMIALLGMVKLDLAELQRAYEGRD